MATLKEVSQKKKPLSTVFSKAILQACEDAEDVLERGGHINLGIFGYDPNGEDCETCEVCLAGASMVSRYPDDYIVKNTYYSEDGYKCKPPGCLTPAAKRLDCLDQLRSGYFEAIANEWPGWSLKRRDKFLKLADESPICEQFHKWAHRRVSTFVEPRWKTYKTKRELNRLTSRLRALAAFFAENGF